CWFLGFGGGLGWVFGFLRGGFFCCLGGGVCGCGAGGVVVGFVGVAGGSWCWDGVLVCGGWLCVWFCVWFWVGWFLFGFVCFLLLGFVRFFGFCLVLVFFVGGFVWGVGGGCGGVGFVWVLVGLLFGFWWFYTDFLPMPRLFFVFVPALVHTAVV
ncbi:hypothetical protein, partial [Pseudomonas syringae group genomosp. 7]|uniref:hypothetical protein n=1 Tax=Pseudomonas syringae group genomosp. 7 TaxID=251699 RepID=UPI0037702409